MCKQTLRLFCCDNTIPRLSKVLKQKYQSAHLNYAAEPKEQPLFDNDASMDMLPSANYLITPSSEVKEDVLKF